VLAQISGLPLDVGAHRLLAGILGAGLGRGCRVAILGREERGTIGGIDEVAQAVPAGQRVAVRLAVSLRYGAEAVGSVAQRGLRFGVKLVEARVTRFCGARAASIPP